MRRFAFVALVALAGCENNDATPSPNPSATASGGLELPPDPSSSAAKVDSAPSALAGVWAGDYDAQKGTVELDPKVTDKAWKDDDGKKAAGKGKLSLTIAPDGAVTGKSDGALGNLSFAGQVDGDMVRATVLPDDPTDPLAMTGVLVGKLESDAVKGRIRVAGPDATLVREATIELKRAEK